MIRRSEDIAVADTSSAANTERLEVIIRVLLYGLVVITPLVIYPTVLNQALSLKHLFFKQTAVIAAYLYLITLVIFGKKLRATSLGIPIIALLILVVISTMLSINVYQSVEGSFMRYDGLVCFLSCIALFFIATQVLNNETKIEIMVRFGVISALLVSVYGIAQSQSFDPFPWAYRMFESTRSASTFGNPVILGGYLALMLPLAAACFLRSKDSLEKAFYLIATIAISLCLVTTMSRAAWLAGMLGLTILFIGHAKKQGFSISTAVMPMAIVAIVTVLAILAIGVPMIADKASSMFGVNESVDSRLLIWESTLKVIPERPLFGFGPDTVGLVLPRYEVAELAKYDPAGTLDNVHNAFLQLAVTSGIPAMVVFILIVAMLCFKAYKQLQEEEVSPIKIGLLAGVMAYTLQSLTGITGIATSGFAWLWMGTLAASWSQPSIEIKPASGVKKYFLVVVVTITGLLMTIVTVKPFLSETALAQARLSLQEGNSTSAQTYYKKAISFRSNDDNAYRELGMILVDKGRTTNNFKQWSTGVGLLEQAVRLSPYNRENNVLLGFGYLYGGKLFDGKYFTDAINTLEDSIKLDPRNFRARDLLGMAYLETDQTDKAYMNISGALKAVPNDAQTHYHMGRYYEKTGQRERALSEYSTALGLDQSYENAKTAYERLIGYGNSRSAKRRD